MGGYRLHSLRYENAVLGLILAWNIFGGIKQASVLQRTNMLQGVLLLLTMMCLFQKSGSIQPQQASVDLLGLEFSCKVHDLSLCKAYAFIRKCSNALSLAEI